MDISVYYYPKNDDEMQTEVNGILPDIYKALEYVYLDDRIMRGIDKKIENLENCICFNVSFEYFYIRENETENMENLKIKEVKANG